MNLVDFLLKRITEDEADWSRAANAGIVCRLGDGEPARLTDHLARRMLAECEAKRRIIALHHSVQNGRSDPSCSDLYGDWDTDSNDCDTLRALVQPYAGHPDFDSTWRI